MPTPLHSRKFFHEPVSPGTVTPTATPTAPSAPQTPTCAQHRKFTAAKSEFDAATSARFAELEAIRLEVERTESDFANKTSHRDGLALEILVIEQLISGNAAKLLEFEQHFRANYNRETHELQEACCRLTWQKPQLEIALKDKQAAYEAAVADVISFAAKHGIALPE